MICSQKSKNFRIIFKCQLYVTTNLLWKSLEKQVRKKKIHLKKDIGRIMIQNPLPAGANYQHVNTLHMCCVISVKRIYALLERETAS